MSLSKSTNITFNEFYKSVYDAATNETFSKHFKELSQVGNRQGMVNVLVELPYVSTAKIVSSYHGKDNELARELYKKSVEMMENEEDKCEEETKACGIFTEALFAASAHSRLFLDMLLERAKRWYKSGAFTNCLKDCECMLALPSSLYEESADSATYYLKCRNECVSLNEECRRKLDAASRKSKKHGKQIVAHELRNGVSVERPVIPNVNGKQHATLESCSNTMTLKYDEKKGRHLVANRDIKTGSVLIVDQPFSFSTNEDALKRNCLHCHSSLRSRDSIRIPCRNCQTVSFCSENCRKEAWEKYHQYECTVFNFFFESGNDVQHRQTSYLLLAYRTTVVAILDAIKPDNNGTIQSSFLLDVLKNCIEDNRNNENTKNNPNKFNLNNKYSSHDYQTVLQLETHCTNTESNISLNRTIEAIFLAKCLMLSFNITENVPLLILIAVTMLHHLQAITCNAYEIIENVHDETTHVWEPRTIGGAIYPTVSLVNHSCYPNVVRHTYPCGTVVVRAIRFIHEGSEILDCYGPHFLTEGRLSRREYLWKKYRFVCSCVACIKDWQMPLTDTIYYKCSNCTETAYSLTCTESDRNEEKLNRCHQCQAKLNYKRIERDLQKSIKKRLSAIAQMYQGKYKEALPLLLDHAHFVEKFLTAPNVEAVKTQQCIVQCYNSMGCTAV